MHGCTSRKSVGMPDVAVTEKNNVLTISHTPTFRSWTISGALIASGIGAAYLSQDGILWQIVYLLGLVVLAIYCFEEWEDCIFDKDAGTVTITRRTIVDVVLGRCGFKSEANLSEVASVEVVEDSNNWGAKGYLIVLRMEQGFSLNLTDTALYDSRSEFETVAQRIRTFLDLPEELVISDEDLSTTDDNIAEIDEKMLVGDQLKETSEHTVLDPTAPPSEPIDDDLVIEEAIDQQPGTPEVPPTPGSETSSEDDGFEKISPKDLLGHAELQLDSKE